MPVRERDPPGQTIDYARHAGSNGLLELGGIARGWAAVNSMSEDRLLRRLRDVPQVSVCVPTRRRPADLERMLASLAAQQGAPTFEVIIVDNDPAGSAKAVAERFAERLDIIYEVETVRGVSSARNRAVRASRAPLLAFIDDDEWAEPDWLSILHGAMADETIDAVIGLRDFVFDDDVPGYLRACGLFGLPDLPEGRDLAWWQTLIGNSCLRRTALPDPLSPFDPDLDEIGGEDSHLFAIIIDRGGRVVGAPRARTHERRTLGRTSIRGILGRALRAAGTHVEIVWAGKPMRQRLRYAGKACVRCLANAAVGAVAWPADRDFALRRLVSASTWAGRAARIVGWRHREFSGRGG